MKHDCIDRHRQVAAIEKCTYKDLKRTSLQLTPDYDEAAAKENCTYKDLKLRGLAQGERLGGRAQVAKENCTYEDLKLNPDPGCK